MPRVQLFMPSPQLPLQDNITSVMGGGSTKFDHDPLNGSHVIATVPEPARPPPNVACSTAGNRLLQHGIDTVPPPEPLPAPEPLPTPDTTPPPQHDGMADTLAGQVCCCEPVHD